jgi:hypothetical protein
VVMRHVSRRGIRTATRSACLARTTPPQITSSHMASRLEGRVQRQAGRPSDPEGGISIPAPTAHPQSDTAGPGNVSLDGRGHDVVSALRGLDTRTDGRVLEFTAARPETRRKLEFTYAPVEAPIKVPRGPGLLAQSSMLTDEAFEPGGCSNSGEHSTFIRAGLPAHSRWPFGNPFFIPLDLVVGDVSVGPPDAATAVRRMLVDSARL